MGSRIGDILLDSVGNGAHLFAQNPTEILTSFQDIEKKIQETHDPNKKRSGWIGYISYEAARHLPDFQNITFKKTQLPEIWFAYYPDISSEISLEKPIPLVGRFTVTDSTTKWDYIKAIKKAQHYIREGDIYQVNLSHRFTTEIPQNLMQYYTNLRHVSPAPYSAFLDIGDHHILSSSPELFFKIKDGYITTRPIKGTMPRGKNREEDKDLYDGLLNSKKDHAELLMITDLERNDLGKICEYGTVTVPELNKIESYAQVHHLVSTITGKLKKTVTPFQALLNLFPGGSITGAPKKRAVQLIQELETVPREIYTGAIGYIMDNGESQFNIAIRTAYTENNRFHFHTGGGITSGSDPEKEWSETQVKSKGIIDTLTNML